MAKREAPSALRNRDPIWNVLGPHILGNAEAGANPIRILEIAAGSGTHTQYFCQKLLEQQAPFCWYATDPDPESLASQQVYVDELLAAQASVASDSVQTPTQLTLDENGIIEAETKSKFEDVVFDVIININMIHISPWTATLGLMKLASEKLKANGGKLYLYGPYKENGTCVESNLNFDQSLKSRDPSWGVRDLEKVVEAAQANGLTLIERVEMPANNLSVVFEKK